MEDSGVILKLSFVQETNSLMTEQNNAYNFAITASQVYINSQVEK